MRSIEIRPAQRRDFPELISLLNGLFTIEQDFSPNHSKQQKGLELLLQRPDTALVVVAKNSGENIVGMASAQLVVSTAEGALSAWIEDLVVEASCQRLGIGSRLLACVLGWASAHGATRAQLLFDLDNLPAHYFYDRMGWQATRLGARRISLSNNEIRDGLPAGPT